MIAYFGSIPLGTDHLTGPTADEESFQNTFVEHKVTRGKPVLQEVGAELDTRSFQFFFDEGFCDPSAEYARLQTALRLKTPQPLVVPGAGYRGQRYVVDRLKVRTQATTRSGRLVRLDATIDLREAPRDAGAFSAIVSAVGSLASAGRAALTPSVRR